MERVVTGKAAFDDSGSRHADTGPIAVDIDSLARLRAAAADHGRKCGMSDSAVGDLIMVANELATNVVRHGGGTGQMSLWCDNDLLYCRVSDRGAGIVNADHAGLERIETTSLTGRGIWLIRQVADRIEIETGERGTTVTVALAIS